VSETNKYLEHASSKHTYKPLLLQTGAAFVHRILKVFGVLGEDTPTFEAGAFSTVGGAFGGEQAGSAGAGVSGGDEKQMAAVLDVWSRFRDQVCGLCARGRGERGQRH